MPVDMSAGSMVWLEEVKLAPLRGNGLDMKARSAL